jgi:signal transduction histidine kinase/ligand-binding sensor domain-containing protein
MKARIQFLPVLLIFCIFIIADLPVKAQVTAFGGGRSLNQGRSTPVFSPAVQTYPPPEGVRFEKITSDDGLSHNYTTQILQDSQGYIWFGTLDGLNKYDGTNFTVYRHEPENPHSLRNDYINSIYEDRSGVLWIGTLGAWLEKYDRQKDQFNHFKISTDSSREKMLLEDRSGVFWVQLGNTYNADLFQFDRTKEEISPPIIQNTMAIYEDRSGVLWLGMTNGQLIIYDRETDRFKPFSGIPEEPENINIIYEDHAGALWIGTEGDGLYRFEWERVANTMGEVEVEFTHYQHDRFDPYSLANNRISVIIEDQSNTLWIGSYGGLDRFDRESGQFFHHQNKPGDPYSLSSDNVNALFVDRAGVLWVGTDKGINKLDLTGGHFQHYKHIPDEGNSQGEYEVSAIYQDREGVLWIGTKNGLDSFDRGSGSWRHYENDPDDLNSLSKNRIWSIYEDSSEVLWIGTPIGLDRYDRDCEKFSHHSIDTRIADVDIRAIHEDQAGTLWIASHAGLFQFDREKKHFNPIDLDGINRKVCLFEDRSGVLWVCTAGDGLKRIDGDESKTYRTDPDDPKTLNDNFVNAILEGENGALWVGTGSGLDRFERKTETFSHYTSEDGLPDNEVLGILEDEFGNLWLSTTGGITRFDPRAETFWNYDVSDRLQSDAFNQGAYFKSSSGEMFFGGVNGVNAFNPKEIMVPAYIPPVVITKIKLFDQPVRLNPLDGDHIDLTYQENTLSFEYVVLDYMAPEKNQYAIMLEGFDQDWIYVGKERFAEYRNLRPGEYVFRVKGANSDGIWNEVGSPVHITITPPFWETWWFRGAIALVLVGVAFGAYRLRVRGIEMRSYELEKQVQERTAELSETNLLLEQEIEVRKAAEEQLAQQRAEAAVLEERSRLARELHDSVTQSLYSVTLYADAAQRLLSTQQLGGVAENLSKAGTTAKEALGEMRSLVYELLPPILEQEGLVAALEARLEAVEGRAGLETHFDVEGYDRLPAEIEAGLYGVAQEALNNTLKHAHAGKVSVSLRQEGGAVRLEIVDDGVGFDPQAAQAQGGMGLRGMAERAEQMGGGLEIQSAPGEGTGVKVTVDL